MRLSIFLVLFSFLYTGGVYAYPVGKFTLKVVDEENIPVSDAKAGVLLFLPVGIGQGSGTRQNFLKGLTNDEGIFIAEGETQGLVDFSASKEGYYGSGYRFRDFTGTTGMVGFRRWEPWNPTLNVILKKKKNPISLYSIQNMRAVFPLENQFVGYDLMKRDWVIPYGQGITKDLLIKLTTHHVRGRRDYKVEFEIKFPNKGDGIQEVLVPKNEGSRLRMPHHAPVSGYNETYSYTYQRDPNKRYSNAQLRPSDNQNFFFRVRTKINKDGEIESALYGKIHDSIVLRYFLTKNKKTAFGFSYYLNPRPNDTNLEFDPEKNLFKDLTDEQRVVLP